MFTSMPPLRRHKDSKPYLVVETNEHVDASSFGTPGVTIVFAPRAQFMPPAKLPVNVFLDRARDNYTSDSWGSSMVELASIAALVEKISGSLPARWRTDLPAMDSSALEELAEAVNPELLLPMLLHAGDVLERLADCAEANGKAYMISRPAGTDLAE